MQAAMVYLRSLREGQELSQADVARSVGVESKQVYRWERGESAPSGGRLIAMVRALRGRFEDVEHLLLDSDDGVVQAEVARALAEDRIEELRHKVVEDERASRVCEISAALRPHPTQFDRWLGYGERLLDELTDRS